MENILISACLIGTACRYDGRDNYVAAVQQLKEQANLIPVCAEVLGGLTTPRTPSECKDGRVIGKDGKDVTEQFVRGAKQVCKTADFFQCRYAVLKERSPSCGFGQIYDGTFSKTLIHGNGVTAQCLMAQGVRIFGESQIPELLKLLSSDAFQ
ncbi:MAG: DUF523 domain-containing protein [Catenibacillus sp.]